jgi:hypothetical protein
MRKISHTITFPTPVYRWLEKEAETKGVSIAEIVRRIVDRHIEEKTQVNQ